MPSVLSRRTWREYGYLSVVLLLAQIAFTYVILVPSVTAVMLVTVVGLFIPGALILGARGFGRAYRGLAHGLLDEPVADPPAFVRPRGFWRSLGAMLADGTGWRALLFMALSFPLSIVAFVVSTVVLAVGAAQVSYPIWRPFLPEQVGGDGVVGRGSNFGPFGIMDSPAEVALMMGTGVVFLAAWPFVVRGFANLYRVLTRALLGPTAGSLRLAALRAEREAARAEREAARAQRSAVVEDADVRLRRIERDLHDGTQARLVAVAMQLGEAREHLAAGGDPALAAELLDTAHSSTKEALTELREIARGIHPPALDAGLPVALETLAARTPLPVTVDVDAAVEADGALSPAVRSIAYFTVAELLTNVVKHAGATGAYVLVRRPDAHTVHLRVRDDGRGGAVVVHGTDRSQTGLAGLTDRVAAVDGTLHLSSPPGGPTVVDVMLPTTTRS